MGYMWLQMAEKAQENLAGDAGEKTEFYETKLQTARFFFQKMLPETDARFKTILAGADSVMSLKAEAF